MLKAFWEKVYSRTESEENLTPSSLTKTKCGEKDSIPGSNPCENTTCAQIHGAQSTGRTGGDSDSMPLKARLCFTFLSWLAIGLINSECRDQAKPSWEDRESKIKCGDGGKQTEGQQLADWTQIRRLDAKQASGPCLHNFVLCVRINNDVTGWTKDR